MKIILAILSLALLSGFSFSQDTVAMPRCPMGMGAVAQEKGAWNMACCPKGMAKRSDCRQKCLQCCPLLRPLKRAVRFAILVVIFMNLMLTILVCQDMSRRGKFNGLWIPMLLVAGVPTAVIYGIFRIGDNLAEKKG